MDYRDEITRLLNVQYPSRIEVTARYAVILFGAGLLFHYKRWPEPLLWAAGYFGMQAIYWRFLTTRGPAPTRRDLTIATALFLLLLIAFIWLPVLALMHPDLAIAFTGAATYGCLLIFLVWRGETQPAIIIGQIVILLGANLVILYHYIPLVDPLTHRIIMAAALLASVAYMGQAMFTFRRRMLRAARAERRNARSQKVEAVGQLAGGIAHEFNNMLTVIQGNLELMPLVDSDEERTALATEAHNASLRAAVLVRQLLAFSPMPARPGWRPCGSRCARC